MVSVQGVAPCVLATRTLDPSTTGSHGGLKRFGFRNFEEKLRVPCFPCIFLYAVHIYIYTYAQTGTFADPTVRRFELFFPFEAGVRFFREISRSIFFLRFQPIKCIRLKSI